MSDGASGPRPVLRVISGDASPEEVAAILAVIAARTAAPGAAGGAGAGAGDRDGDRPASLWADHGRGLRGRRTRYSTGPNGWRTSFWP